MNKEIIIFSRYFLPGYKAGGPVESIATFVKLLHKFFQFNIFTTDRDFLDKEKYPNIHLNTWQHRSDCNVFYLEKSFFSFINYFNFFFTLQKYQVVYLTSLFDIKFTTIPLIILKLFYRDKKIILAPRGELYLGAISIKKRKKLIYLNFLIKTNLLSNIIWHATSAQEIDTIKNIFKKANIVMAPNIVEPKLGFFNKTKSNNILKLVFFSRITPKKNLLYVLGLLAEIKVNTILDIYGPIDDVKYWDLCKLKIKGLKLEDKVNYCGSLEKKEIFNELSNYDLFILPTLGENFGHVIFDAIKSGLPILISDKTPWNDLKDYKIGWSISLEDRDSYIKIINNFNKWWIDNSNNFNKRAFNFLNNNSQINKVILKYKSLFNS